MDMIDDAQIEKLCLRYENNVEELQSYWDNIIYYPDKADYALAAAFGLISFLINTLFVGDLSLENASDWGAEKINQFVVFAANKGGYKGENLKEAVAFLERAHPMASDSLTSEFGGGKQHHLRDFNHHCSLSGLICSIYTQFTGKVLGTDVEGTLKCVLLTNDRYIGETIPEKLYLGVIEWAFHLISDMAGSSTAKGKGTGIPGLFLSSIKCISAMLPEKEVGGIPVSKIVSKLFNGTFLAERDAAGNIIKGGELPFDLRTELGCIKHFEKQTLPIMINKVMVIICCTLRNILRLFREHKINSMAELLKFEGEIIPRKAMADMLTVSLAVFDGLDTIKSAYKAIKYSQGVTIYTRIITGIIGYVLTKNFVADQQLIAAIIADIKINIKTNNEQFWQDATLEKNASDFLVPNFDSEQTRVIDSAKRCLIVQDINSETNNKDRQKKREWLQKWESEILLANSETEEYFYEMNQLSEIVLSLSQKDLYRTTLLLMLAEILYFYPYFPIDSFNPKCHVKKYILQDCFCELFQDNAILMELLQKFKEIQIECEVVLTPEYSPIYLEQCKKSALDAEKKWHLPIKCATSLVVGNPLPLLINKEQYQKGAERLSETFVSRKRDALSKEEKMFYQSCVKQLALIQLLPHEEAEIIINQMRILQNVFYKEMQDYKTTKATRLAARFLEYLERCGQDFEKT